MPFIHTMTNVSVSEQAAAAIKAAMGKAITLLPGKTEDWLMVAVSGDNTMFFKGSDAPCAIAEVKIYGKSSAAAYDRLTGALTEILAKELSVTADRIYVKYEEVSVWGWNGSNF